MSLIVVGAGVSIFGVVHRERGFVHGVCGSEKSALRGRGAFWTSRGLSIGTSFLLILVVLRELTDFFPGGATGFGVFLGKWRKKIWNCLRAQREGATRDARSRGLGFMHQPSSPPRSNE